MNNVPFIIFAVLMMCYIIYNVRKSRLSIKESFWWIIAALVMLLLAIFPYSIDWVSQKLNIAYPPSILFVLCILFLVFLNFRLSKKLSELQVKVIDIAQELAILKEKCRSLTKKDDNGTKE